MNSIRSALGVFTAKEYLRRLGFCLPLLLLFFLIDYQGSNMLHPVVMPMWLVVTNTILYPYSEYFALRFVRSIDNERFFIFYSVLVMIMQLLVQILSWYLACLIVPLSLVFLPLFASMQNK